jgi:hypothetical protein
MIRWILIMFLINAMYYQELYCQDLRLETVDLAIHYNDSIKKKLILFPDGPYIKTTASGSILQNDIPKYIGLERFENEKEAFIVVQKIPTKDLGYLAIEPSKHKSEWWYLLSIIVVGLIGGIIALVRKISFSWGFLIGGVIGFLIVLFSERDYSRYVFTIDNSTQANLSVHFDKFQESVSIPKLSQITLGVKRDRKQMTIKDAINDSIVEKVNLDIFKVDSTVHQKSVLNVGCNNVYYIDRVAYKKIK